MITKPVAEPVSRPSKGWGFGETEALLYKQLGFEPTGEEQARVLRSRARFKVVSGGDQAGKSLLASKEFARRLFEDMVKWPGEPLLYWLVAQDYGRTRAEFNYIGGDLEKLGLPVKPSKRIDPGEIVLALSDEPRPRLRIETKSGKDPRTLAMEAPHGIIVCEASQTDVETYQRCLARLGPKRGWLFMSGTHEGSLGWWPGLVTAWAHGNKDEQSFIVPSPTNWHLYPGGMENPEIQRIKRNSSDAFFNERIMGVAAPPTGRVMTEFRPDVHIRDVEYQPGLPVYIWEDPGYGHAHAIEIAQVFQGGQVQVIDEIYERERITEDLIEMCQDAALHPWWKAEQKKLVIDPHYATQHQAMTSVAELWLKKTGLVAYGKKMSIADGTERFKSFLKVNPLTGAPKIVFNPKCKGILSELGAYPDPFDGQTRVYSWKKDREGNVIGEEPEAKWNDGISAVTYGLVEEFGFVTTAGREQFIMRRF